MRCINPLQLGPRTVPCGKCNFCLQVKRGDWSFRISNEFKYADSAVFATLTYDESNQPWKDLDDGNTVPTLLKRDVQLFKKRLRKECAKLSQSSVRYYSVGEYGTVTSRPHYHSILFNVPISVYPRIQEIWSLGNVLCGSVTPSSIHYVTKYVINRHQEYEGREPPFALMSKRPGIGARYLETHSKWHLEGMRNYAKINGYQTRLPRYYKDRIFSERERSLLAYISVEIQREQCAAELSRIGQWFDDPYLVGKHYAERVLFAHDAITSKLNSLNKF